MGLKVAGPPYLFTFSVWLHWMILFLCFSLLFVLLTQGDRWPSLACWGCWSFTLEPGITWLASCSQIFCLKMQGTRPNDVTAMLRSALLSCMGAEHRLYSGCETVLCLVSVPNAAVHDGRGGLLMRPPWSLFLVTSYDFKQPECWV